MQPSQGVKLVSVARMPAFAFRRLQVRWASARLAVLFEPPLERGMMWSHVGYRAGSSQDIGSPQMWQRPCCRTMARSFRRANTSTTRASSEITDQLRKEIRRNAL